MPEPRAAHAAIRPGVAPPAPPARDGVAAPFHPRLVGAECGRPVHAGRRHRVLVVDDDLDVLRALQESLQEAGMLTFGVPGSQHARQALAEEDFDLVLTDLYLAGDDLGLRVAEAAQSCRPAVPVVLLTAHPSFDGAQGAVRSGVADVVVKPVLEADLIATCERTIAATETRRVAQRLEAQNRVLARVLPRAIEAKDPTTHGHSERVVAYTETLALLCGIGDEERASLRMAALLHDVGKVGIPDGILCKEGPLTTDEREVMKQHPLRGYEILEPLEESEDVRTWVYQHHERWDGRGYPCGLRSHEVALPGRILILAEVYDALAEERSYKPAWEVPKIVEYFRHEAGGHFDPDLARMVADGLEHHGRRFFTPAGLLF